MQGFQFGKHRLGLTKLSVYLYFVDGLLIDTGQSLMRKQILEVTQQLPVEQIFITHHHEDHTGNIAAIKTQHPVEVLASPLCCELMKAPPPISFAQKITWGNRPPQPDLTPIENTLKTNHFSFQLIPIPGHATDMLALYEPNRKWLFSADLFISSYIDYFLESESMATQIASIKKVLALDFNEMFCNHKPLMENGREKLTKKLLFLENFFQKVAEWHGKGYSPEAIFKAMKLKENWAVRMLSGGTLSKLNMVRSVIRDVESGLGG